MKFLVVADFHYALKQWDWLKQAAPDFDLVIFAGDLLDIVSIVDKEVQILVTLKYLRSIQPQAPLLVTTGNHDGNQQNDAGENVVTWLEQARDFGVVIDGESYETADGKMAFTLFPWWDGDETRAEAEALLKREAEKYRDRDITWTWVYHVPPQDSPISWTGKVHFGDPLLGEWIQEYRPDMVFCGHVHQAPFVKDGSWVDKIGDTWIFNMGKQIGPIPAQIVMDTEAQTAEWYSLAGAERIHLDRDFERIELA